MNVNRERSCVELDFCIHAVEDKVIIKGQPEEQEYAKTGDVVVSNTQCPTLDAGGLKGSSAEISNPRKISL